MAFVLFLRCNPLPTRTCSYLMQCSYKTRSYSLKDYESVFLKRQNLVFSIVVESIFAFCFRLNIFKQFSCLYSLSLIELSVNPMVMVFVEKLVPCDDFDFIYQGSTNCADGDERERNVHAKGFSRTRNYVHVNQSKHL